MKSIDRASYVRGWNNAMDYMANFINSLDTEHMTKQKIRSALYKETGRAPT